MVVQSVAGGLCCDRAFPRSDLVLAFLIETCKTVQNKAGSSYTPAPAYCAQIQKGIVLIPALNLLTYHQVALRGLESWLHGSTSP